jgi:hypothetical protein
LILLTDFQNPIATAAMGFFVVATNGGGYE